MKSTGAMGPVYTVASFRGELKFSFAVAGAVIFMSSGLTVAFCRADGFV